MQRLESWRGRGLGLCTNEVVDPVISIDKCDVLYGLYAESASVSLAKSNRLTIFPTVRVPVLSEQSTDMQPSVSTVAKFFTSTCRFAIFFATMVRDNATLTGRP